MLPVLLLAVSLSLAEIYPELSSSCTRTTTLIVLLFSSRLLIKTPSRDICNFPHSGLKASFYRSELSQILAK